MPADTCAVTFPVAYCRAFWVGVLCAVLPNLGQMLSGAGHGQGEHGSPGQLGMGS